ncbi:hypothetical protein [Streptomyces sp. NPDC088785]|uniref:hypothetical protein n=1 Tax=Streptomyces sp. NPDC088785 TaxID=3365897 RepID=UPI0038079E6B
MAIHYSTFVLPPTAERPARVPMVLLFADSAREIGTIPLITSVHRVEDELTPYRRATAVLDPLAVSGAWARAVRKDYGGGGPGGRQGAAGA